MASRPLRDSVVLALAAALLFTVWLGARDLWNPNEPTYGRAVAEMAQRGDWLIPSVNDVVFPEKPILYFWMARAAGAVTGGVDEWSLRIPSAVSGVAVTLLVYLLVLPYAGVRRARYSAIVLATTYIVFWSARSIQMDLLVAACVLGCVTAVVYVLDHGLRPGVGWALAGLALGLGFLSKGPVAVVCVGLVLAPYAVATGRFRALVRPEILWGAPAFLVVAAPWFVWLGLRGETGFLHEVLIRQNFDRFVDPWDHQAPWWYYAKYFWLDNVPWALFLPLAVGLAAKGDKEARLERLCWIWIVAIVLFFSLSESKRSPYILPAAPAMAILVAGLAERWLDRDLDRWRWRGCALVFSILSGLLLGCAFWLRANGAALRGEVPALTEASSWVLACLVLGGAFVAVGVALSRRAPWIAPSALLGFVVAMYVVGVGRVLPAADAFKSHRPFCDEIRANVAPDEPLAGFGLWRWRAAYSYYSDRSLRHLETLDELADYWADDSPAYVVVERGRLDHARNVLGDVEPIASAEVGSNAAHLFGNAAARRVAPNDAREDGSPSGNVSR
jgi:4-amino-4-deoxy-L-arabinose transferase-like glycosyltransferase